MCVLISIKKVKCVNRFEKKIRSNKITIAIIYEKNNL